MSFRHWVRHVKERVPYAVQGFPFRSHALLREVGMDFADNLKQEVLYVRERVQPFQGQLGDCGEIVIVQGFPFRSHALLQEAGINLVDIMKQEGFYVRERVLSAPANKRGKNSFGEAAPIELPTAQELATYADKCATCQVTPLPSRRALALMQVDKLCVWSADLRTFTHSYSLLHGFTAPRCASWLHCADP